MLDTLALKYLLVMDLSAATYKEKYFDYIQVRDCSQRWSRVQPLQVSDSENLGNAWDFPQRWLAALGRGQSPVFKGFKQRQKAHPRRQSQNI